MSSPLTGCDCPLCVARDSAPQRDALSERNAQTESEEQILPITPLPKLQLSVVIGTQIAESVTSTVIYPFVNDLVRSIGVTRGEEKKTGYYVGAVVRSLPFLIISLWLKL
jgi:hypothetical protein